jgi:hypothetical protein
MKQPNSSSQAVTSAPGRKTAATFVTGSPHKPANDRLLISRAAYLRLDGLLVQARQLRADLERIRQAACAITGEPDGGHTDEAVLHSDAVVTVPLLRLLGIGIADAPNPPTDQWSVSHAIVARPENDDHGEIDVPSSTAELMVIFTLDALGRPFLVTGDAKHGRADSTGKRPQRFLSLADGTPVVQITKGHFRTTGRPPHVDLYSADASAADLSHFAFTSRADGVPA